MRVRDAALYARLYELAPAFSRPDGVFALAEAIGIIETAWADKEEHLLRIAFLEVVLGLEAQRRFLDVAQALVEQMLSFDRERNHLLAAAKVAEWAGQSALAMRLREEASLAPDKLAVR